MIEFLSNLLNNQKELIVLILSISPFVEAKGAIIVGYLYGFSLYKNLSITLFANIILIPFLLLFIKSFLHYLTRFRFFKSIAIKITNNALNKSKKIKTLQYLSLCLFTAIPLPASGGYSAALIASILNLDFKKSFFSISLGIIISTIIVSFMTYGIIEKVF